MQEETRASGSGSFSEVYFTLPPRTRVKIMVKLPPVPASAYSSWAAKGGVGFAKASGNYAAQFYPTKVAKDEGFQQIIWTDSNYHDKIEEAGTMNLFFRINNELITSPISDSILDGITRKSIIDISKSMGLHVIEREITVSELLSKHDTGLVKIECLEFDKYGRLLIKVFNNVDELSLNEIMVNEGHGKWYDGGTKDTVWN